MNIKLLSPFVQTAAILVVAGCLLAVGCKTENQAQAVDHLPEKTPVLVTPVTQVSATRIISVSGTLAADKTTPTGFLVAGKVDRMFADEGDHVPKAFLLATVEAQDYKNRLDMARAKADTQVAIAELNRQLTLDINTDTRIEQIEKEFMYE
ncbi:hypothetical protein [Desulfobacter vibrioformis]|uniref:hypothetical protein n=1 Tax=Desulfobacter vibrioformis TaxID=34031 RepID=UPI000554DF9B|nr:hypothetical protein [Desulfobacter vibrioformis]